MFCLGQSLIIDDQTDVPIWKSALQAMKRSKERCQAIKAMMKKMKRSESRDRVLDNSAYFKPDEKQMLTPLNEENHFKRNVRIIETAAVLY